MATEIQVPTLGESVSEATVGRWFKQPGDPVKADEPLVELETDKVTLEVNAPAAGTLGNIAAKDGETVTPEAVLGSIVEGAAATALAAGAKPAPAPKAAASAPPTQTSAAGYNSHGEARPSGQGGSAKPNRPTVARGPAALMPAPAPAPAPVQARAPSAPDDAAREERVRMTKLRQTIARRLKDAQNTAAMLTTFNDVDMGAVMSLRNQYKDMFEKKHGGEARLHGLLHQGLRPGPEGNPGRERRGRRPGSRLQELLPRRDRGRHREGACRPGGARRGPALRRRDREEDRRVRQARPRRAA